MCPRLIIWGRRDAIIPLGHGRLAHLAFPGSELEIFDEAGHFPHHTDPARFVRVVAEFVEGTDPAEFEPVEWRDRLVRGGVRPRQATMKAAATELQMLEPSDTPIPGTH